MALPRWLKAWAAHARVRRQAAQPARTPGPGSGHSDLRRVAQCMKTASEPERRSPCPPHLEKGASVDGIGRVLNSCFIIKIPFTLVSETNVNV